MKNPQLGMLGVCDTRPSNKSKQIILLTPPFLRFPEDPDGTNHLFACLAWTILTTKNHNEFRDFMLKAKPVTKAALRKPLINCKAWLWLQKLTNQQIRASLKSLRADEIEPMRTALNDYRNLSKNNPNTETQS